MCFKQLDDPPVIPECSELMGRAFKNALGGSAAPADRNLIRE